MENSELVAFVIRGEQLPSGYCVFVRIVDTSNTDLRPFQAFYGRERAEAYVKASNYIRYFLGSNEYLELIRKVQA